eukprot:621446_1
MSVVEVDLKIGCPACKDGSKQPTYWVHTKCNTRTTITRDGKIGCRNVRGGNRSCRDVSFKSCAWKCHYHTNSNLPDDHQNQYWQYNKEYAAGSVAKAVAGLALRLASGELSSSEFTMIVQALQRLGDSI